MATAQTDPEAGKGAAEPSRVGKSGDRNSSKDSRTLRESTTVSHSPQSGEESPAAKRGGSRPGSPNPSRPRASTLQSTDGGAPMKKLRLSKTIEKEADGAVAPSNRAKSEAAKQLQSHDDSPASPSQTSPIAASTAPTEEVARPKQPKTQPSSSALPYSSTAIPSTSTAAPAKTAKGAATVRKIGVVSPSGSASNSREGTPRTHKRGLSNSGVPSAPQTSPSKPNITDSSEANIYGDDSGSAYDPKKVLDLWPVRIPRFDWQVPLGSNIANNSKSLLGAAIQMALVETTAISKNRLYLRVGDQTDLNRGVQILFSEMQEEKAQQVMRHHAAYKAFWYKTGTMKASEMREFELAPENDRALVQTLVSYVPRMVVRRFVNDPHKPLKVPETETYFSCVLFADISGFTPLTAQMATLGAEGVERVTTHLNDYFRHMINLINEHGGDVVKFAGDALIVIWPTATQSGLYSMVLLGCQCALALQRKMGHYVVGDTELRLHIGVGAGKIAGIHVGGVGGRQEFFVAGQPMEQVGSCEAQAEPGEIFVSPECQAIIEDHFIGEQIGTNFKLENLESPMSLPHTKQFPLLSVLKTRLKSYVPAAVLANIDTHDFLAELRTVSVLFVKLDYTYLNEEESPMAIQIYVSAMQTIIARYEGTFRQFLVDDKGSVLIAAFGVPPLAHEDDPKRAVECALDISKALRSLSVSGSIGITTGKTFCGAVGSEMRREYAMVGDVVNLSARLMVAAASINSGANNSKGGNSKDKTEADSVRNSKNGNNSSKPVLKECGILCDRPTYLATKGDVEYEVLNPISVKGKENLIEIFRPIKSAAVSSSSAPIFTSSHLLGQTNRQLLLTKERDPSSANLIASSSDAGIQNLTASNGTLVGASSSSLQNSGSMHGSMMFPSESGQTNEGPEVQIVGQTKVIALFNYKLNQLSQNADNPGHVLVLEGDPGIGKSKLAEKLVEMSYGTRDIFFGTLECGGTQQLFGPWAFVFDTLLDLQNGEVDDEQELHETVIGAVKDIALHYPPPDLIPSWESIAPLLNIILPLLKLPQTELTSSMSEQSANETLQTLLLRLLQTYVIPGSIIILEDAHEFDSASWTLALAAAQQLKGVLLVLCMRPPRPPIPFEYQQMMHCEHSTHVLLKPLSAPESVQLAEMFLGVSTPVPPPLATVIKEKGQGNPFIIEQIIGALRSNGEVSVENGRAVVKAGAKLHVPTTVDSLITAKIDRLSATEKNILKIASVIGKVFDYSLVKHLLPSLTKQEILEGLFELQRSGLILREDNAAALGESSDGGSSTIATSTTSGAVVAPGSPAVGTGGSNAGGDIRKSRQWRVGSNNLLRRTSVSVSSSRQGSGGTTEEDLIVVDNPSHHHYQSVHKRATNASKNRDSPASSNGAMSSSAEHSSVSASKTTKPKQKSDVEDGSSSSDELIKAPAPITAALSPRELRKAKIAANNTAKNIGTSQSGSAPGTPEQPTRKTKKATAAVEKAKPTTSVSPPASPRHPSSPTGTTSPGTSPSSNSSDGNNKPLISSRPSGSLSTKGTQGGSSSTSLTRRDASSTLTREVSGNISDTPRRTLKRGLSMRGTSRSLTLRKMSLGSADGGTPRGTDSLGDESVSHLGEASEWSFRNNTIHEVVYSMMLFSQRRHVHSEIAKWYMTTYNEALSHHAAVLGYHLKMSEENPAESARWFSIAGQRALRNFSNQEAVSYFLEAIQLQKKAAKHAPKSTSPSSPSANNPKDSASSSSGKKGNAPAKGAKKVTTTVQVTTPQERNIAAVTEGNADQFSLLTTHRKLGQAYFNLGDFNNARLHLKLSLKIVKIDVSNDSVGSASLAYPSAYVTPPSSSSASPTLSAPSTSKHTASSKELAAPAPLSSTHLNISIKDFSVVAQSDAFTQREVILALLTMAKVGQYACSLDIMVYCNHAALCIAKYSNFWSELAEAYAQCIVTAGLCEQHTLVSHYMSQANRLAQDHIALMAIVNMNSGLYYISRCAWQLSKKFFQQSMEASQTMGDRRRYEDILIHMSQILFIRGKNKKSIAQITPALESARLRGDVQCQILALIVQVAAHIHLRNFVKATSKLDQVRIMLSRDHTTVSSAAAHVGAVPSTSSSSHLTSSSHSSSSNQASISGGAHHGNQSQTGDSPTKHSALASHASSHRSGDLSSEFNYHALLGLLCLSRGDVTACFESVQIAETIMMDKHVQPSAFWTYPGYIGVPEIYLKLMVFPKEWKKIGMTRTKLIKRFNRTMEQLKAFSKLFLFAAPRYHLLAGLGWLASGDSDISMEKVVKEWKKGVDLAKQYKMPAVETFIQAHLDAETNAPPSPSSSAGASRQLDAPPSDLLLITRAALENSLDMKQKEVLKTKSKDKSKSKEPQKTIVTKEAPEDATTGNGNNALSNQELKKRRRRSKHESSSTSSQTTDLPSSPSTTTATTSSSLPTDGEDTVQPVRKKKLKRASATRETVNLLLVPGESPASPRSPRTPRSSGLDHSPTSTGDLEFDNTSDTSFSVPEASSLILRSAQASPSDSEE